ncbi:MAG: triose-phosphate isomerase, partial [Synergistaceae bacterium]|nr:triose-phosphate isomerase [Synergistaceae bacterium]
MADRARMIAGNWKMNNGAAATRDFFKELEAWLSTDDAGKRTAAAAKHGKIEIVVAPPFTSITAAVAAKKSEYIGISAQNAYFEPKGAFTGEISLQMLEESGCKYVILGHSERRHVFGETDGHLKKKLDSAFASKLSPIFCVGELLEERESGETEKILERQLSIALGDAKGADVEDKLTIAYEPVWAIGTGKVASNDDAQTACAFVRSFIAEKFGAEAAQKILILYGGSVKHENSGGILAQKDIDGLLIGGA